MTARKAAIADLPDWPRGLSLEQAAAYLGMSAGHFTAHVAVQPIKVGSRIIYDREQLDRWFDSQREGGQSSGQRSRWLERLDADANPRRQ